MLHLELEKTNLLNPYFADKISSAKCIVCYNFQGTSKSFEGGEILSECQTAWIRVRRDAELLGVSSEAKLFAYGTLVVTGRIRVNCRGSVLYRGSFCYTWGQCVICKGVIVLRPPRLCMTVGSVYYIVL